MNTGSTIVHHSLPARIFRITADIRGTTRMMLIQPETCSTRVQPNGRARKTTTRIKLIRFATRNTSRSVWFTSRILFNKMPSYMIQAGWQGLANLSRHPLYIQPFRFHPSFRHSSVRIGEYFKPFADPGAYGSAGVLAELAYLLRNTRIIFRVQPGNNT